jgi:hypothetical protein
MLSMIDIVQQTDKIILIGDSNIRDYASALDREQRIAAQTGEVYQLQNYAGHFTNPISNNLHGGSKGRTRHVPAFTLLQIQAPYVRPYATSEFPHTLPG